MFKDFENWLNINTLQTSAYVRNLHYLPTLSSISVYVRNSHHLPTLTSISGHYRRFQLNDLLSQLTKLALIVDRHSPSPSPPPPPPSPIVRYIFISTGLIHDLPDIPIPDDQFEKIKPKYITAKNVKSKCKNPAQKIQSQYKKAQEVISNLPKPRTGSPKNRESSVVPQ